MSFKLIALIVVLASDAISGNPQTLGQTFTTSQFSNSIPSQIPNYLLGYNGFNSQQFPQTFQPFSAATQMSAQPLPQSIPQHLLTAFRNPQYVQSIPSHFYTYPQQPSPVAFNGFQSSAQPLTQSAVRFAQTVETGNSFGQQLPIFNRSPMLSPAQMIKTQIVQPISQAAQPIPSMQSVPVSVVSQRDTLPAVPSTELGSPQTFANNPIAGNTGFQTPTGPLTFAPNLPEVQRAQQLVNQTDNTFKAEPIQTTPFQQTLQPSDFQFNSNTVGTTSTVQQPFTQSITTFTQPIGQTMSQPMFTTQQFTTPQVQTTPFQSTSTDFNANTSNQN